MPISAHARGALVLIAASLAAESRGEVLAAEPGGFATRNEITVAAAPARVYERLLEIGRWWSDEHTYTGAARNMKLEAKPNGCFCEALADGGFIEHGRVVYAATARTLRLDAALGPLHEIGGSGSLNVQLDAEGAGTKVTLSYVGTGFAPGKGVAHMAPLFDEVLGEQVRRLKRYVEGTSSGGASASPRQPTAHE